MSSSSDIEKDAGSLKGGIEEDVESKMEREEQGRRRRSCRSIRRQATIESRLRLPFTLVDNFVSLETVDDRVESCFPHFLFLARELKGEKEDEGS
jgi:hypothetical protein